MAKARYNDYKVFQKITDEYFLTCDRDNKTPTKQGYRLILDLRADEIQRYVNEENISLSEINRKEISSTIKKAYDKIEEALIGRLLTSNSNSVAGLVFYLKNAFHYRDRQDLDIKSAGDRIDSISYVIPETKKVKKHDNSLDLIDQDNIMPSIKGDSLKATS